MKFQQSFEYRLIKEDFYEPTTCKWPKLSFKSSIIWSYYSCNDKLLIDGLFQYYYFENTIKLILSLCTQYVEK